MSYEILELEGVAMFEAELLANIGIRTTDDLLVRCGSAPARRDIGITTGIDREKLLRWANLADLMRIRGIGPQYAELLEEAGVVSIQDLRTRFAPSLFKRLRLANQKARLVRAVPPVSLIEHWIADAREIEPGILSDPVNQA